MSRNPLYVFSTIGAFGIGCMTGSIGITLLLALACHVTFLFVIMAEEGYLESTFGQAYRDCMQKAPRFFRAFPAFEFVEYLQDKNIIPVFLHVY